MHLQRLLQLLIITILINRTLQKLIQLPSMTRRKGHPQEMKLETPLTLKVKRLSRKKRKNLPNLNNSCFARVNAGMLSSRRLLNNSDSSSLTMRMPTGTYIGTIHKEFCPINFPNCRITNELITLQACINCQERTICAEILCEWKNCSRMTTTYSRKRGYCPQKWQTLKINSLPNPRKMDTKSL